MIRAAPLWVLLALPASGAFAQQHAGHGADDGEHDAVDMQPSQSAAVPAADHAAEHAADQGAEHAAEPTGDAHAGHEAHAPPDSSQVVPGGAPPAAAFSGPKHAADVLFDADEMAAARELLRTEQGGFRNQMVLADRFEARAGDGDERLVWDLQGWYGGDLNKLWWKSEGTGEFGGNPDDAAVQLLYSRAVTPYFDFQAGVRHDFEPSPRRSHAVLGVQGVLPYVFEIDAAAFVSEEGDVTGRVEAEYDLRIRQRLVLQPRVEMSFSAQSIPELAIDSGLGAIEGGFRLRYEIRRELAPYIGIGWERKTGGTADFARRAGEDPRGWKLIAGIRAWF